MLKAFLSIRFQTVVLDNEKSSHVAVTSGVQHGSMLGSILFLVYINDLPDSISICTWNCLYLAVSNLENAKVLQEDLDWLGP